MAVFLNQAKNKILDMRTGTNTTGKLKISKFAVSDYDYESNPISASDTSLQTPCEITAGVYKKAISSASRESGTSFTVVYECELEELECVGKDITAIGLYDDDDLLVCIKSFPAKSKTNTRTMTFYIRDSFEED